MAEMRYEQRQESESKRFYNFSSSLGVGLSTLSFGFLGYTAGILSTTHEVTAKDLSNAYIGLGNTFGFTAVATTALAFAIGARKDSRKRKSLEDTL